jgi:O-antigen/teichoic acid export membrane protein
VKAGRGLKPFLAGGALLFASATLVNAGNYLFNLILGRWLGPAAFADISLIVTLFLVTSFLTAGLQIPAARFAAVYAADGDLGRAAGLRRWGTRAAAGVGLLLLLLLAGGAGMWAQFFGAASPWPFVIFGLCVPFYLVQGVHRGVLQGLTRFRPLALTYQVEMWSRLLLSFALVGLGFAVNGAVLAIGLSFVAAWLLARQLAGAALPPAAHEASSIVQPGAQTQAPGFGAAERRALLLFAGPVLAAQLGQILINNSDILIVRHFFPAVEAGHYAALALIGRIVFFATWSVVTAMLPIAAQRYRRGEPHRPLLYASLAAVLAVALPIVALTIWHPVEIVNLLFGPEYTAVAPLLWLYAVATLLFALGNVIINYRLSLGDVAGTYLAIAAGAAQVAFLWTFHASLAQVVWVQVGLMAALFGALAVWDMWRHWDEVHGGTGVLAEAGS